MVEKIFKELEYIYSRENFNRTFLEQEILLKCNGNGTVFKEVLKLIKEYRNDRYMSW